MTAFSATPLLDTVETPADLRQLAPGQLRQFADELRTEMIAAVGQTGGHLGSGLGVVELTVAIHYVFNTPADRLVWDVGHQAYPHKILTGRRDRIRTLRQGGGLSGFTKRSESEYDPFGAAHSSTSISAALGFAVANKLAQAQAEKGEAAQVVIAAAADVGEGHREAAVVDVQHHLPHLAERGVVPDARELGPGPDHGAGGELCGDTAGAGKVHQFGGDGVADQPSLGRARGQQRRRQAECRARKRLGQGMTFHD